VGPQVWFLIVLVLTALFGFLLLWSLRQPGRGEPREEAPGEPKAKAEAEAKAEVPRVEEKPAVEASPEEAVKSVLIRRLDGIKGRDPRSIAALVDMEGYTKFDDWPPFERQGRDALRREAGALRLLRDYEYETGDWSVTVLGDTALASFTIRYRGAIRDLKFDVRSRVTAVLVRREGVWRLTHEHWSRFPGEPAAETGEKWWK